MLVRLESRTVIREIALALAVKAAALTVLYFAFFASPPDADMTPDRVAAVILDRGKVEGGH